MNLFTYIKNNLSIFDVVNQYTTLKKAGLYWKSNCPFHQEKTASFTVSTHKEIFYCFGCHIGGDVISFIAQIERCSQMDAAKLLIEQYKLTIPQELLSKELPQSSQEKERYFALCALLSNWTQEMLAKHYAPRTYLEKRTISSKSQQLFGIGYFPGGPAAIKALLHYAQGQGFLVQDLLEYGILLQGKTVLYSAFEERILFPIKDQLGRVCGFGGRVYKEIDERAKYYNSRENSFFAKGSLLFGFDSAKQVIAKKESVFLVEGYTDCIIMVQAGYTNTVATLGTACTIDHLSILARHAQKLYVLYDADKAGQEAVLRLTQLCWQVNIELYIITLPANEDPASWIAAGKQLEPLIKGAKDIFTFYIESLGQDFASKTLQEKLQLIEKITSLIAKIESAIKQDVLLQQASTLLSIPFASLKEATRHRAPKPIMAGTPPPASPGIRPEYPMLEKKIFFAIMQNIQIFNQQNEEYLLAYLPHPFNAILTKLKQAKTTNNALNFMQFFDILTLDEQQCVSALLLEYEYETSIAEFEQLLTQLQKKHWKHIVQTTKAKIAEAEQHADAATVATIVHSFLDLQKKMLHKLGKGN